MEMRENLPLEDVESSETTSRDSNDAGPFATSAVHRVPRIDPSKNLPNPSPIPENSGDTGKEGIKRTSQSRSGDRRAQFADESLQIAYLKEKQYAWHCQACLAEAEPQTLAPLSSYVEGFEHRRRIIEAQHCDHVSAGGARHVGNIVLLCIYHHGDLGDAVSRTEVTRAFGQASIRTLTFSSGNGVSKSLRGRVITIQPPQRQTPVSFFFTEAHADFWLMKATEEGLL